MATKPFPELEEAVAEIRREESRRQIMLSDAKTTTDGSAMKTDVSVTALMSSKSNSQKLKQTDVPVPAVYCEHCKKPWHTKEQCWDLIGGRPANWKSRSERLAERRNQTQPRANIASNSAKGDDNQFSKGQIESLKKMLADALQLGKSSSSPTDLFTGSFAQGGGIREDDWSW
ncbi:hypothetical protein LINPERPRIM_LOCUS3848 [Linum perenne]